MPTNRFPDSLAKRELRRRDERQLANFRCRYDLAIGLHYCGMPSVKFLDVRAWHRQLRSVCAVEIDDEVLRDMRIEWNRVALKLPVRFIHADVLDYLEQTAESYDLYNLDFYGGLINPTLRGNSRCMDAIRALVVRHAKRGASFVLIATFNLRDRGTDEYNRFLDEVPAALAGWNSVDLCCKAHRKSRGTILKLCFPYFCWHVGSAHNFAVHCGDVFMYQSSVTLLHFYLEFHYQAAPLPSLTSAERSRHWRTDR